MRRIAVAGLTFMLAVSMLSGCGSSKDKAAEATTESTQETITVDYAKGLNDDGTLSNVKAGDIVKVCGYSAIEVPADDVKVSDDDVQSQIDSILQQYPIKDKEVKDGDVVNIDYVGKIDDKEFDGGSDTGYDLTIGSQSFIDDFEQQLIGHKPGDQVEVKVTFPDDYSDTTKAGKDAVFSTTINYINPVLTDDFVKENLQTTYGYKSVKNMKKEIRKGLKENNEINYIWQYLIDNSKFETIPDELVNDRLSVAIDSLKSSIQTYGYSMKDYLSAYGYEDEAALKTAYTSQCEQTVKQFLIADVIAAENNITVTEDAMTTYFDGQDSSQYTGMYGEAYVKRVILNSLVMDKVMENAKIK